MTVEIALVAVTGDVAQIGQVRRLGVDDGVEIRAGAFDLVGVDRQVRVELAGEPGE